MPKRPRISKSNTRYHKMISKLADLYDTDKRTAAQAYNKAEKAIGENPKMGALKLAQQFLKLSLIKS